MTTWTWNHNSWEALVPTNLGHLVGFVKISQVTLVMAGVHTLDSQASCSLFMPAVRHQYFSCSYFASFRKSVMFVNVRRNVRACVCRWIIRCDAVKSGAAAATAAGGCVGRRRKPCERRGRLPAVPEVLARPGDLAASHAGVGVAEGPGTCADDGRFQSHLPLRTYACRAVVDCKRPFTSPNWTELN